MLELMAAVLVGFVRPKNGRTIIAQLKVYRRLPGTLLYVADEQTLLQYYRQLSQADQGFIRGAAQALVLCSGNGAGSKVMSSAIRQVISIADSDLTIIEHQGERVVTLPMVDQVHQRPEGTARKRFNDNRSRFVDGKHVFKVCADEFRRHKPGAISNKAHEDVILLTQRGYLLLVKSFTDDLSWQVQDMLVDSYFEGHRLAAPPITQRIAQSRHRLALAKELHRTRDAGLREVIHQQLDEVSRAMGLPTPELESLGSSTPKAPDVLKDFWDALSFLDSKGVAYNHATASNLLALNLRELANHMLANGRPLRFDSALRQALWQSHAPRCLHKNRAVHSRLSGKSMKCWVFEI